MIESFRNSDIYGGGSGIRTHGTLTGPSVFKTDAFDRSAIPPVLKIQDLWAGRPVNQCGWSESNVCRTPSPSASTCQMEWCSPCCPGENSTNQLLLPLHATRIGSVPSTQVDQIFFPLDSARS